MSTHFWASCQCGAHGMQRASVPKPQGNREMRDLSCWISCSDHVSKQLRCFGSGFLSLPFTWALLLTNLNPEQPPPPLEECCFSAVGSLWQPSELIRIGSALISGRALLALPSLLLFAPCPPSAWFASFLVFSALFIVV